MSSRSAKVSESRERRRAAGTDSIDNRPRWTHVAGKSARSHATTARLSPPPVGSLYRRKPRSLFSGQNTTSADDYQMVLRRPIESTLGHWQYSHSMVRNVLHRVFQNPSSRLKAVTKAWPHERRRHRPRSEGTTVSRADHHDSTSVHVFANFSRSLLIRSSTALAAIDRSDGSRFRRIVRRTQLWLP